MALFANAKDLRVYKRQSTPILAASSFVASAKISEALSKSGHLAVSAPSQIMGKFQLLKTLCHDHLCEYVDIHRGKHDRLFIVAEHHEHSLQKLRGETVKLDQLRQWTAEILSALEYLLQQDIIHTALSPHNILLDDQNHIKLSNYGLYYMTDQGANVEFPIGYPAYLAPECLSGASSAKVDYWALGIILVELYKCSPFWTTSDIGLIFDSLTSLAEWAAEDPEQNVWLHPGIESLDINKDVLHYLQHGDDNPELHNFILACLVVRCDRRPDIYQLLSMPFLKKASFDNTRWTKGPVLGSRDLDPDNVVEDVKATSSEDPLRSLPISRIYHLWRLAGGDVELSLIKRGVFLSMPVIERLPRVCLAEDGAELGSNATDTTQLYSDAVHVLGFKELYQRLDARKNPERFEWDTNYFMVVDENDVNFLLDDPCDQQSDMDVEMDDFVFADDAPPTPPFVPPSSAPTPTTPSRSLNRAFSFSGMNRSRSSSSLSVGSVMPTTPTQQTPPSNPKLPLILREQNVNYQYQRQALFAELLRQYPASRKELIHHAKVDIPPLLRGKVWAAILGVHGDLQEDYDRIEESNDLEAYRQIDVDVPRCHQYNQLLASSTGHEKLRRLLKSWVSANRSLAYWQGLDSICAPFLTLNYNDEALAFACLQKFIPRYLNNLFLKDNAHILHEHLAVFRHLLSFHDPQLSSHLDTIRFQPDLYAIPWFLTLFTHVFPLDKIYHLWDKFLVGPPSLPLFAGVAILRQVRDNLLSSEFNDCIGVFSESFPKVDIGKCIQNAMGMCKVTPPSMVGHQRSNPPETDANGDKEVHWWQVPLSIEAKKLELAPRIDICDVAKIAPYTLTLDIRSEQEFSRGHLASSMNVQPSQLKSYAPLLKKLNKKYHLVVASQGDEGSQFAAELVHHGFSRTALLQGGTDAAKVYYSETNRHQRLCTCKPQKQTTAGHKGKGSEPPFIIWRCKVPSALSKK